MDALSMVKNSRLLDWFRFGKVVKFLASDKILQTNPTILALQIWQQKAGTHNFHRNFSPENASGWTELMGLFRSSSTISRGMFCRMPLEITLILLFDRDLRNRQVVKFRTPLYDVKWLTNALKLEAPPQLAGFLLNNYRPVPCNDTMKM